MPRPIHRHTKRWCNRRRAPRAGLALLQHVDQLIHRRTDATHRCLQVSETLLSVPSQLRGRTNSLVRAIHVHVLIISRWTIATIQSRFPAIHVALPFLLTSTLAINLSSASNQISCSSSTIPLLPPLFLRSMQPLPFLPNPFHFPIHH